MPLNIDFQQILLHLLNFTLLFAGLYFLLYKPVKNFMKKREKYYQDMQESADEMIKHAEDAKSEYEGKLRDVDAEIISRRKTAAEELEKQRRKKIEDAETEAAKIIEDAREEGQAMRDQIISSAKGQITDLVEDIARKALLNEDVSTTFDAFLDAAERGASDGES